MTLEYTTLRPGFMVSVKTSIRGNVRYNKIDLDKHTEGESTEVTKWETTRTISDADEHDRAVKARSLARSIIGKVCVPTAFNLLCREESKDELDAAIAAARKVAAEFNATASVTRLSVYIMVGFVAATDEEAVRSINSEMRDLMDAMTAGIEKLDVKAIREAADKARDVGKMLTEDAQARVQIAIDTARSAARTIKKAGEAAAVEIDALAIRKIVQQRTAFLDLSDEQEIARPQVQGRAIDLAPEENNNAV